MRFIFRKVRECCGECDLAGELVWTSTATDLSLPLCRILFIVSGGLLRGTHPPKFAIKREKRPMVGGPWRRKGMDFLFMLQSEPI